MGQSHVARFSNYKRRFPLLGGARGGFGFAVLLGALLTTFAVSPTRAAAPARPNIVFILLDNVGQEWFGCYGSEEKCTPNIDRLARTGVRVEHCYTPPVCGPSRIVLLSGRYLLRSGFTMHHDAALYSGGGFDPKREITFARPFRDAGYATGIAGKWQINNLYDEPDVLKRHGFDEQLVWPGSIDSNRVGAAAMEKFRALVRAEAHEELAVLNRNIESRYWDPVLLRNGKRETHPGKFGPDLLQSFALEFLQRHRGGPFLLYYPMVLTHGKSFVEPVVPTPLNLSTNRPHHEMFADMVRYADKLVGELVVELERLGLRDNTLVFIASDNGTEKEMTARRNGREVRGGLYTLTEAGGDVVLLANSPKLIPGGRTAPLADFSDVLPTLCDLAGIAPPKNVTLDGRSLAPFLRGEPGAKPPREWIFNQYASVRVVRDTRFKLYSDGRLFDANADPDEQHDLAASGEPAAVAARERLGRVLQSLPPDSPPPFVLRSLSGFKLRAEQRAAAPR
ncbi:MAG: sulfatase-like hydrolase/transferase [Verrucomicrobia bacterium]|nr:sulfatase-like hydrolase/transferase [Verrucomicrobiota bacterium]